MKTMLGLSLGLLVMLASLTGHAATTNIWTGSGNASVAGNWSENVAPQTTHHILLDGASVNDMTWDAGAVHTVASWTQTADYTGTVTIATTYPDYQDTFTNLTIQGDCVISNGVWTHKTNPSAVDTLEEQQYRLSVTIGGDLVIGNDGVIDVTGEGFRSNKGPGKPVGGLLRAGASHGGRGAPRSTSDSGPCYGSITRPMDLGSGGDWESGGGAVFLTVRGEVWHDGLIAADGGFASYYAGAGGSIYLQTANLIGTGDIRANGGAVSSGTPGGGGRIALIVTNAADFSDFTGSHEALGYVHQDNLDNKSASGTVYLETQNDLPGRGELFVKGTGASAAYTHRTDLNGIEAVTYDFSRVTLTNKAVIGILPGDNLIATNTVFTGDITDYRQTGIVLAGGSIQLPDDFVYSNLFVNIQTSDSIFRPAASLTLGTNAVFIVDQPYVMTNNLMIAAGGILTHTANPDTETEQYKIRLTVHGDLTVAADGCIDVIGKGYPGVLAAAASYAPGSPTVGNSAGGSYGGVGGGAGTGPCYGSIIAPTNLGSGGRGSGGSAAGGAVILTVNGQTSIDGSIFVEGAGIGTADGHNHRTGSGGSLYLVTGTLIGGGTISANGGESGHGSGGGGRIAMVVTNAALNYDQLNLSISALGGYKNTAATHGGAGTIYFESLNDAPGQGTLIIDNENVSNWPTEITANVTDTAAGHVLFRNNAYLLLSNQVLTVSGVWSNTPNATFTAETAGEVVFADTGVVSRLYGDTTFLRLTSTTPGKIIEFEAGSTTTLAPDGRLMLQGDEGDYLLLRSSADGNSWFLVVDGSTEQLIEHVDVRDSDAAAGVEVIAMNSSDSGNNENWLIVSVTPGETITWTGDSSATWSTVANWDLGRAPVPTDLVNITGGMPNDPVLDDARTVNQLQVQSGAALYLNGYNLAITNKAVIAGALVADATETITFQGDADFTGGTFTPVLSTLALAGDAAQVFQPADLTFGTVAVLNDSATVTFSGGLTATELRCEAPAGTRALTFQNGAEYHLSNLILQGAAGETNIVLRSTSGGQPWYLNVSGYRSVRGVDVADSDADGGLSIPAMNSLNSGGNPNWVFDAVMATWQGTIDDDFHNSDNWNPAVVPDEDALVVVDTDQTMTISQAVTVRELIIGGGTQASSVTVDAALTLVDNLIVLDNGTLILNKPTVVSNNSIFMSGSLLTHTANTTLAEGEKHKIDLTVLGDLRIDVDAIVDAKGKGYEGGEGPGRSVGTQAGASHGGRGYEFGTSVSLPCYGSIIAPTNLGSGGSGIRAGGGAILIKANGTLRHDGVMDAGGADTDWYSGSGGSVRLRAGALIGAGEIRADAGATSSSRGGAGGRISMVVTNAGADFTSFSGPVSVFSEEGGPGTIYRETASDGAGKGTVTLDNDGVATDYHAEFPPASPGYKTGEADYVTFRIANKGGMKMSDDFSVGDIWLDTEDAVLDLNDRILNVNALKHHLGPNQAYDYLGNSVEYGPNQQGEIVWLRQGMLIMIR